MHGGLWKLNRRIKQSVQPLIAEQYGLDIRKYFILQNIRHGRVYPKQIAENLDMPSTLLSRYLDGLHTQGLIERQIDPHDSRRTLLSSRRRDRPPWRAARNSSVKSAAPGCNTFPRRNSRRCWTPCAPWKT
ncbi:MarR family transcriptional regulator [Deinococcus cavernae]|uniref:MarR family transcriptional regulator n=1 Tax=Deinococcus cavernae TaxID=2320857 RepID=A0A418V278_9DEIO|nr:MarR family transcriptional regulator [Deinococcus cavernae]